MVWFIGAVVVLLIFLTIKGYYDRKNARIKLKEDLKKSVGTVPATEYSQEKFESISYYYKKQYKRNPEQRFFLDRITWNDLAMDELFMTMNNTASAMGEEYLMAILHEMIFDSEILNRRERAISWFEKHPTERLRYQMAFAKIGKNKKISIFEYMDRILDLRKESNTKHFVAIAVIVLSVFGLVLQIPACGFLLVGTIGYNIVAYYRRKGEIEPYLTAIAATVRLMDHAEEISKFSDADMAEFIAPMQGILSEFKSFRKGAGVVAPQSVTGDIMSMFTDYFHMIFHTDLIKFNSMLDQFTLNKEKITILFETVGFLDAMCAVASFRAYYKDVSIPILHDADKPSLIVQGMYHPFVTNPVKTDLVTEKSILVTGSNASGKSTFLKEVAINAVLAQSIHTALCDKYEASYFKVLTSIALTDNIFENESYYIVEIKSLKRIMDAMEDGHPTLCFVDEVLRGTNTVERIAASSRILKTLSTSNALCFAATHDIELTYILEEFFDNYHFEEKVEDGQVLFDYLLRSGRATSQNAIELLQMFGYPPQVIASARAMAKQFMENGEWEKIGRFETV